MATMVETPTADAPTKERKPLTDAQKQAASLRRDASLLEKYGQAEKAAELHKQADQLAPASAQGKRVDPMKALSNDEKKWLKDYFRSNEGFAALCKVVSYNKLKAMLDAYAK